LKFGIPHGYMLQVMNRSSVAAKRGLVVGAHVIDSGYDGEVFINIHNISNQHQILRDGMKIAQLVMIPVVSFRPHEIREDELYLRPITISDRGDGALGSTGG
jgi:dUTP pyrophosphatase